MNRREFLKGMAAAGVAVTSVPLLAVEDVVAAPVAAPAELVQPEHLMLQVRDGPQWFDLMRAESVTVIERWGPLTDFGTLHRTPLRYSDSPRNMIVDGVILEEGAQQWELVQDSIFGLSKTGMRVRFQDEVMNWVAIPTRFDAHFEVDIRKAQMELQSASPLRYSVAGNIQT